jgi:hypothetical protein
MAQDEFDPYWRYKCFCTQLVPKRNRIRSVLTYSIFRVSEFCFIRHLGHEYSLSTIKFCIVNKLFLNRYKCKII